MVQQSVPDALVKTTDRILVRVALGSAAVPVGAAIGVVLASGVAVFGTWLAAKIFANRASDFGDAVMDKINDVQFVQNMKLVKDVVAGDPDAAKEMKGKFEEASDRVRDTYDGFKSGVRSLF